MNRSNAVKNNLCLVVASWSLTGLLVAHAVADDAPRGKQLEFFESRIRPVLVEHCYECHNSAESAEAGLALDDRKGMLKGGDGGAIVVPGQPGKSRLLAILRHEVEGLEMPQEGPKLETRVVADFKKWIEMGAHDPRDKPPTAAELTAFTSWDAMLQRRKQWWSFRPILKPLPPAVQGAGHPIDRFVLAKLAGSGLRPARSADPATLVRRLYFNLIGLPPGSEEASQWTARIEEATGDQRTAAIDELIDHLLESPRFGERWARHWMDWIRYAESHGSEGDPAINNAWMYRDYLIRALNADVPYDQLVREHIAGDLLEHPRVNKELGINESIIGPAHWRMVFHGFAPTDALDEKVRFTDDQINAFSKAFLGLTVSCARCHNHKFDAISQADYYALFGILGSCRPGRAIIDLPERQTKNQQELKNLKAEIRVAVAGDWLASAKSIGKRLSGADGPWKQAEKPESVLHPLFLLRQETAKKVDFDTAWRNRIRAWQGSSAPWKEHRARTYLNQWNLAEEADYGDWFPKGVGLPNSPQPAGEFAVAAEGDLALTGVYPSGAYSHGLSAKHPARLTSPDIRVGEQNELWVRVIGDRGSSLRYVVQNYPRQGTVYPVTALSNNWRWQRYDLTYWNGDDIHIELTAAKDAPLLVKGDSRSWFGVREAVILRKGQPAPSEPMEHLQPLFEAATAAPPESVADVAALYQTAISTAVNAWKKDSATDSQALLLDACLRQGLLSNRLDSLAAAKPLLEEYRRLENEIPIPTRVPGLDETIARNQPLFERGNHKLPTEEVPRRFLEAIDGTPYETNLSGRRQLAEDVLRDDNPLSRRVIVNRIWHHLFGRGIVATSDNFGRLGQQPSHPELLDWLATRFVEDGWSLKKLIRLIVTTETWQRSSHASREAYEQDPNNLLLSHANVRRLEAEAIRDSLLTVSGRLENRLYGGPVDGNSPRRSVYVRVIRNSLNPFLRVFDFPEPFSATGRRDVTNVPAQSLTMMNDPQVINYAAAWANQVLSDSQRTTDTARIEQMFVVAFGRPASDAEVKKVKGYLSATKNRYDELRQQLAAIQRRIAEQNAAIGKLTEPVRAKLLVEAKKNSDAGQQLVPAPIHRWEFDGDFKDAIGSADGESRNGARVEAGALILKGQAHVITKPLQKTLKEKTLEAWVQLDNLNQRGGGVLTIQTPNGVFFDAIVFGERDPRQWLAGSNNFARTQPFGGPQEQEAQGRAVHIAVAYHADGRVVGYRDGRPYGKPFKSNGPYEFKSGNTVIGFGVRHLPACGNRMLAGKIELAQVYDRALTADEIAATSRSTPYFVTEKQVLAALSEKDRQRIASTKSRIATLQAELTAIGPIPRTVDDRALWTDLARAMFTFKEFIYVQ